MKLGWFLGVAATGVLVATGSASAANIQVLAVNPLTGGGAPGGFTSDLGTGVAADTLPFADASNTVHYNPASPGDLPHSGEYDGNVSGQYSSPFGSLDTNRDYAVAEGDGGSIVVTFSSARNELDILWGTVDIAPARNVITFSSGDVVNGQQVAAAALSGGFGNIGDGIDNVLLRITGLTGNFTSATFTDAAGPAFEFDLASPVPGPIVGTGLPGLVFAAGGLLGLARKRRQRCA